jgi:hypothetical protein
VPDDGVLQTPKAAPAVGQLAIWAVRSARYHRCSLTRDVGGRVPACGGEA